MWLYLNNSKKNNGHLESNVKDSMAQSVNRFRRNYNFTTGDYSSFEEFSACDPEIIGSIPGSAGSLGKTCLTYWWWSESPMVPLFGSLASVSVPQSSCVND